MCYNWSAIINSRVACFLNVNVQLLLNSMIILICVIAGAWYMGFEFYKNEDLEIRPFGIKCICLHSSLNNGRTFNL